VNKSMLKELAETVKEKSLTFILYAAVSIIRASSLVDRIMSGKKKS